MSDTPNNDDLQASSEANETIEMDIVDQGTIEMDSLSQETQEIDMIDVENQATSANDLEQELAEAQLKIKDYWDQIVRLNAEMDNHRKRAERDVENAHKYAVKNFSEALLPVCDSMEMGIAASDADNASLESIKEGMEMTMSMFRQMFEKNGIAAIDPVGEKFNPEQHQAMSMQESADHEPNTVMAVMQKGYLIKDRLIRPAMVMVSKESSD